MNVFTGLRPQESHVIKQQPAHDILTRSVHYANQVIFILREQLN